MSAAGATVPLVLPASKLPQRVLLIVAVALYSCAGVLALGYGDGNYPALVAFASAAFAGAWAIPGESP